MRKLKLLWVNEASFLNTGYSNIGREVMSRLHKSGQYEIAELAAYGHPLDQRRFSIPWRYYGNDVFVTGLPTNEQAANSYRSDDANQFGKFRFEEVVLHFQPDVVVDIRDEWMFSYQANSPLRPYFHWVIMPTVDASPQENGWIDTFSKADMVLTYTRWAQNLLKQQGGGILRLAGDIPSGVNDSVFVPMNKPQLRKKLGLSNDLFVVGTVMRNQKRKLYPNLLGAFAKFLKLCLDNNNKDLYDKSYLYLHTTYPDIGWDIPDYIKKNQLSSKVLMTYLCKSCGFAFPSFFQDSVATCTSCGQKTALFPTTQTGVSTQKLAEIHNLFDCYVQYANSEGFGIPMIEAAACGVPVFATDYSAMSDVVRRIGGYPVKVKVYYYESETHCQRAIPDDEDFIGKLYRFATLPEEMRARQCFTARKSIEDSFTWETVANKWHQKLQSIRMFRNWGLPPNIHQYSTDIPGNLNNAAFVHYCYQNLLGRPDLIGSFRYLNDIRDLDYGYKTMTGISQRYFNQEVLANELIWEVDRRNYWEKRRCGIIKERMPDFIQQSKGPQE